MNEQSKKGAIVLGYIFCAFIFYVMGASSMSDGKTSYWKSLKEVDDRGFQLSAEAMGICSEMVTAVRIDDEASISLLTEDIEDSSRMISDVAEKRQAILKELGY